MRKMAQKLVSDSMKACHIHSQKLGEHYFDAAIELKILGAKPSR